MQFVSCIQKKIKKHHFLRLVRLSISPQGSKQTKIQNDFFPLIFCYLVRKFKAALIKYYGVQAIFGREHPQVVDEDRSTPQGNVIFWKCVRPRAVNMVLWKNHLFFGAEKHVILSFVQ